MDKLEIIAIVSIIIILLIWYFSGEKSEGFVGVLRSDYSISRPMSNTSMASYASGNDRYYDMFFGYLNTPPGKLTAAYLNRLTLINLVPLIEIAIPQIKLWLISKITDVEKKEYKIKTGKELIQTRDIPNNVSYVFSHPYEAFIYNGPMSYGAILLSLGFYEKMLNDMKKALSKLNAEYDSCSTDNCRDIVNKKTIFMRYYFHTGTILYGAYYTGGHTKA